MKWLAGIFLIFLIAVVVAADRGQLPGFMLVLYTFPGGDKFGHFFLMGLLSFLVNMALLGHSGSTRTRRILLGSLAVGVLVTIEEFSQRFFATRNSSWGDLASSYAGIICFTFLVMLIAHRRQQLRSKRS